MTRKSNGEGSIWEDKKTKKLIGQYVDSSGKRKAIMQKKNETKTDFKKRFTKLLSKKNDGMLVSETETTLYDIINNYIEYKHSSNITSDNSYKRDCDTLKALKKHCNTLISLPIQKITIDLLRTETLNITSYSQSFIDKLWRLLKIGFKIAIERKIIVFNIIDSSEIKKPKSDKETTPVEALSTDEQKRLVSILNSSNKMYSKILLIQLYTGMRIGEVLALTLDDIDLKNDIISINKTITRNSQDKYVLGKKTKTKRGTRQIPITDFVKPIFEKQLKENMANIDKLIFYDYKNGCIITPNEINCYLKRLNTKYQICDHIHTHMLRHTFATRCIEANVSAKVLQELLGHTNIETTFNVYAQVFNKFKNEETSKYTEYIGKIL